MEQIKSEGEKVAKNENIFRYYSKNEENLKKQIAELDVKIQETMKKQTDLYPADVKLVENQIDEEIEKLNKTTDISKLTEYEKKINQLITKKAKIVGEKSPSGSYLKQLNNQRVKTRKRTKRRNRNNKSTQKWNIIIQSRWPRRNPNTRKLLITKQTIFRKSKFKNRKTNSNK